MRENRIRTLEKETRRGAVLAPRSNLELAPALLHNEMTEGVCSVQLGSIPALQKRPTKIAVT